MSSVALSLRPLAASLEGASSSSNPTTKPLFLKKIPIEIRNQIYEHLLLSPALSERPPEPTHDPDTRTFSQVKYELSTAILKVCKQTYQEASAILYGNNVFFIWCSREDSGERNFLDCPITRHLGRSSACPNSSLCRVEDLSGVRKVRHWKVCIDSYMSTQPVDFPLIAKHWSLTRFCRAICQASLTSLDIYIVPRMADPEVHNPELLLRPLQMLRNVGAVSFRDFPQSDMRRYEIMFSEKLKSWLPRLDVRSNIETLLTGTTPVELLFKMWESLVSYAQGFERFKPFRLEMALGLRVGSDQCTLGPQFYKLELEDSPWQRKWPNIFRHTWPMHPVEGGLSYAKEAADNFDAEAFKSARRDVLLYLEQQYWRIVKAMDAVTDFIKSEKQWDGLLDITSFRDAWPCSMPYSNSQTGEAITHAMLYLEDLTEAFQRDMPTNIRARARQNRRVFDSHYNTLPRDQTLKHLNDMVDSGTVTFFGKHFKSVMMDMDDQYLKIVQARHNLFKWDVFNEWGVGIDLDLTRSIERINWNVNEPDMTPAGKAEVNVYFDRKWWTEYDSD